MDTDDTVSRRGETDKEHANKHNSFVTQQTEKIKNSRLATSEKGPQNHGTDKVFKAEQASDINLSRNIESSIESFKFKQKDSCNIIHNLKMKDLN